MPKALIIRVISQGMGIILYRLSISFLIYTAKSAKFIAAYYIWVTLYRFRAVALCPTEVIEIELCYAPEKPRFIKIRLCTYCLIEILY
jgi:hypothetical protein